MKLTVIGSGTSVPHPKRSGSGFWLDTSGGSVLLDCSPSSIHRMAEENLAWAELDAIWISHFHLDHVGGLAPFLFSLKHAPQTWQRTRPLSVYGGAGLRELVERFDAAGNYRFLQQHFPIEIIEVAALEPFEILPGVEAVAMKTPHTDASHAIHIRDTDGKTLVFTADTGLDKGLSALANGVDLFVLECSFVTEKAVELHLHLPEAMYLIRKAQPKRAMLMHFYPEWDEVDFKTEVGKFEPFCEVIEATDGLTLDL